MEDQSDDPLTILTSCVPVFSFPQLLSDNDEKFMDDLPFSAVTTISVRKLPQLIKHDGISETQVGSW